jgi:N-acetylmuramoyl-L-alanine amidase
MRSRILPVALLLAAAGCQGTRPQVTHERQETLKASSFVGLHQLALDLDLSYCGDRAGIVELSLPPDSVVLVSGDRIARVNGRPVPMDHAIIRLGDEYALHADDAGKIRRALGSARRSRPSPSIAPPSPAPLPRDPLPGGWLPRAPERRWTHIIIHHSATPSGSAGVFHKLHLSQGWENGLGYHFLVGNGTQSGDGEVEVSRRWREQLAGAHTRVSGDASNRWNENGIGVCLVGDFTRGRPTERQMDSLVALVRALRDRYGVPLDRVIGHGHVDATECPGANFPWDELRRRIR